MCNEIAVGHDTVDSILQFLVEAGEPVRGDCYDHVGAGLFNWYAPELWRRFTIHLRHFLARRLGVPASRAYAE